MDRRLICFLAFSIFGVGVSAAETLDCTQTLMKWARAQGFRLETSGGSEMYCRELIIVGSRIPYNQCGTEAEVASYAREVANDRVYPTCTEDRR
jgi:hypothetical protein